MVSKLDCFHGLGIKRYTLAVMSLDTHQSVYREQLLAHLVVGELLKHSWLHHNASLEVSAPAIDRSGHDLVLEANRITRHVQFKSSASSSKTSSQKVHVDLAEKASGCVIWIVFDAKALTIEKFFFFGGAPGAAMPSIDQYRVAKHTRGNAQGVKRERPNLHVVPRSLFTEISSTEALYEALFGG